MKIKKKQKNYKKALANTITRRMLYVVQASSRHIVVTKKLGEKKMLDNTQDYSLISNEQFAALSAADRRQIYVETADYSIDCAGHAWPEYKLVAENWQISDSELLAYKAVDYLIEDAEQAAAIAVWKQIDSQDNQ